ncbi:MAG TPA: alpha-isopropylmalate synthase regulatory domain-containing protein [Kofleriaceae bacterium]|nr:alpha-isopropylmalate synthase regulatory domain-containing protein [Kofleriaceae bacterium]
MTKRPHANLDLIRRVLGSDFLALEVKRIVLDEDAATGHSKVRVEMVDNRGNGHTVEGEGVGMVDAFIGGLFKRYEVEYQSLKSIELASFSVQARLDTKQRRAGGDAVGEVTLEVRNSEGNIFTFSDSSRSISSSTARAVIAAVEYFVNAERAFITLYKSRQDARERNRDDLVTRYTEELAEVVKSTSYAEVIENIRKELGEK